MKRLLLACLLALLAAGLETTVPVAAQNRSVAINVALNTPLTPDILSDLARFGRVLDTIEQIAVVRVRTREGSLDAIRALSYVAAANPDAERTGRPIDTVSVEDFSDGLNTWDQDAVDVTDFGAGRTIGFDGTGVYVAVLDTGLLDSWRQYFPQERIATQFAKAFSGGGMEHGRVAETPNVWEHDQNSHGTHVTSTILGYSLNGVAINGTAPNATVIPVKVLNQAGFGWSSVIARGIVYIADLKANGDLGSAPVVINMSLSGPVLDAAEEAAIDYAIGKGVIIVAAAGNEGEDGMGYPGAYAPVISVAASGWVGEWANGNAGWWVNRNVPDPTNPADFYITDFSSRALTGQDLDVAAPGSWVVGPYQTQSGKTSYFFLGGTSMASPHVAGIAALMLQKNSALGQAAIEAALETTAIPLAPGCRMVPQPSGPAQEFCWEADATGAGLATASAALAGIQP